MKSTTLASGAKILASSHF